MARNDITIFDEFLREEGEKVHDFSADTFKLAILDNTAAPAAGTATPRLADFTEVGSAGNYTAGGATLTITWNEAAGTVTLDETTNPTWAANASNDTDAYWALLYNSTDASDRAIAFIDLGGPVDMSADDLTITWNASGIATKAAV